jgi:hypothetical protein
MKRADVKLATYEEGVSPVTILDAFGRVIRVVPAAEFRRIHGAPIRAALESSRHRRERVKTSQARHSRIENDVTR